MVIRRRDRHDLCRSDGPDGAGRDDRALAFHEARHRRDGADRARVREGDRRAREVIRQKPVGARLLDERLIGGVERREVRVLGVPDHGHEQRAAPVLLFHVHRQPEVHAVGIQAVRLPVHLLEGVCHDRKLACGTRDRETDEMREGDLLASSGELRVQLAAPGVEDVDGDLAEGGGRGYREAVGHVLGETSGRTRDGLEIGRNRERGAGSGPFRCSGRYRSLLHAPQNFGAIRRNDGEFRQSPVIKQLPPLLADGGGIPQVLLIHHLHERGVVRAEDELAHGRNLIKPRPRRPVRVTGCARLRRCCSGKPRGSCHECGRAADVG